MNLSFFVDELKTKNLNNMTGPPGTNYAFKITIQKLNDLKFAMKRKG